LTGSRYALVYPIQFGLQVMPDQPASRSWNSLRLRILSCLSVLVLGASQVSALEGAQGDLASGLLLAQDKPLEPEPQAQENSQTLFAILEEALAATQAKLEESLARAHAAREDSEAKAAELAKLREHLEAARHELATATSARGQLG
jgi:hypothetical protein